VTKIQRRWKDPPPYRTPRSGASRMLRMKKNLFLMSSKYLLIYFLLNIKHGASQLYLGGRGGGRGSKSLAPSLQRIRFYTPNCLIYSRPCAHGSVEGYYVLQLWFLFIFYFFISASLVSAVRWRNLLKFDKQTRSWCNLWMPVPSGRDSTIFYWGGEGQKNWKIANGAFSSEL